jgi:hypothetical protein
MPLDSTPTRLVSLGFLAIVTIAGYCGCNRGPSAGPAVTPVAASSKPPAVDDELLRQIDDALKFTHARRLDTSVNAAWQIIHGCIPFRQDFLIRHEGRDVRAIDFLFGGGMVEGWEFEPGIVLDESGRRGLRAIPRPGSNRGQGHEDQWLGYLSGCAMPLETPITVDGVTYSLADYLAQIEHDIPRNMLQEYSWTLMALATYRDHDHTWVASDGKEWNIDRLVEVELEQDLTSSPCGGSHRMVGLTMALNKRKAQGAPIEGVWKRLDDRVAELVARAREYQNADGALSSNYFARPGKSVDLADAMGSAGHVLEFLTVALDDEALREPWVTRAVQAQCKMFRQTKKVDVECGALYHSASALRIYRERIYGPMTFAVPD